MGLFFSWNILHCIFFVVYLLCPSLYRQSWRGVYKSQNLHDDLEEGDEGDGDGDGVSKVYEESVYLLDSEESSSTT